jgi:hypothetical protein
VRKQQRVLEQQTHSGFFCRSAGNILTIQNGPAGRVKAGRHETGNPGQQRRFARAGRAHNGQHSARTDNFVQMKQTVPMQFQSDVLQFQAASLG